MKGNNAYRGLKSFSIQNPNTRSFMSEWFAHKLFEKEDVLTTKYIFVPVIINGQKMGVYALEEHFDKQLLEARNRREAPIVKFDEEGVW
ncbi:MAG: CotH kinase family protein, partial [Flavobacteriales bacterium]